MIAVEVLALLVRNSTTVQGAQVAGKEIRISQYADDATFFLNNFTSLDALLDLLETFAATSGLQINAHKSHLLLLGRHLDPPETHGGIRVQDQVTILGISFRNHMSEAQQYTLNFEQKLRTIKDICLTWLNRNLSLKGKVVLIKSLMSSILQYPCSCLPTPTRVLVEYKKIILQFFWNGRRGKVSYNLLLQDIQDGGLKLPDLATRIQNIHLYWIKQLWQNQDSVMVSVIKSSWNNNDIQSLLRCKRDLAENMHNGWTFIRQILRTWAKLHIAQPDMEEDIQKEMIWDNTYILIEQKPFSWQRWREAGISSINDLLHDTVSRFLSHTELGEKFDIAISFLEALQIRSAIPCTWKRKLVGPAAQRPALKPTIRSAEGLLVEVIGKLSRSLYSTLIKFLKPNITSQAKWNAIFPVAPELPKEYWANIYKMPYK